MTMLPALACATIVLGLTPGEPFDPTDPGEVAKQSGATGGDTPLAGPDVDPSGGAGRGGMRGGQMTPMMGMSVEWILQSRCSTCHGTQKQKAGVQLAPVEMVFAGDERDWTVVPGKPEQSELITRIKLPDGHDDMMPPEGRRLTAEEITVLEEWVRGSTSKDAAVRAAKQGQSMGQAGNRAGVDPQTWYVVYMSLDLTQAQRTKALELTAELRKIMAQRRRDNAGNQRRPGGNGAGKDSPPGSGGPGGSGNPGGDAGGEKPMPPSPAGNEAERRKARESFKTLRQQAEKVRTDLWAELTPEQQESLRTILADPEAIKKLRRQQRRSQGDRRRGRGVPPPSPE